MKALTVKQPWASLIACGVKTIENRRWKTRYRGRLVIHAALQDDRREITKPLFCHEALPCADWQLPRRAIVAICELVDCVPKGTVHLHAKTRLEWAEGPWCWILRDVRAITPIPCPGARGLWDLDPKMEEAVRALAS